MSLTASRPVPRPGSDPGTFRATRRRVPTVLQMEAVECGAAALTMVLAYYGRWVPLEKVREACHVTRDGADALNIIRAAREFGLVARGMRGEVGDIGSLPLPAVAFWNFNHFIVVEGGGRRGVWVNDPAGGPIVVPWADFDLSFTGVTLVFEPGPNFVRTGRAPSLFTALASRLRGARSALALCLVAGLALIIPGLTLPVVLRVFVDRLVAPAGGGDRTSVAVLVAALIGAAALSAGLSWIQQLTLLRLATKLAVSMSTRFFDHLLRLPIEFFQQRYAGTLVTRTNVNDQVAMLLSSQFASAVLQMLTVVFYASLMVVYSPSLAVATIGFGAVNLVVLRIVARKRTDANRRLVLDSGKMTSTAMGGLQNIETVKAIGEESGLFARWSGQQAKVANARAELGPPTVLMDALPAWLLGLNTIFIVGFGGLRVLQGSLTLGTLAAFQVLAANFAAPISQLVGLGGTIQEMTGQIASVDDVLNYEVDGEAPIAGTDLTPIGLLGVGAGPPSIDPDPSPDPGAGQPGGAGRRPAPPATIPTQLLVPRRGRMSGLVELRDVTFGYDRARPPLIEGLSLVVRPGARVAIIGSSGSGKSTVAKLVCGLHQPWSGQILFDDIPRQQLDRRVLASSLALVDQEIVLFEGTVRDNLTLWDPTIRQTAVVAAARDAAIHRDIVERPGGFDRVVEEAGRDWSGGQRQRLEIARALATEPSVLVLDEATSALDALVEVEIDANLRGRGCSCLIVAHRLSTIRDADEILVMHEGRVAERGTHEDLVAAGGRYASLVGE